MYYIGGSQMLFLSREGNLIILSGGNATREEILEWEDNLRKLEPYKTIIKESQQAGPGYPPQGVGSPDP
jgi:hypothetical protein